MTDSIILSHILSRPTLRIGDRIRFRSPTRAGAATATRIVNGFDVHFRPTVRFVGWSNFVVYPHEILEVIEAD